MPDRLVSDFMVPIEQYAKLNFNESLKRAVETIKSTFARCEKGVVKGHRSVLVMDDHDNLVGILTVRSILAAVDKASMSDSSHGISWKGFFARDYKKALDIPVKNVMLPIINIFVLENSTLSYASHLSLSNKVNLLPVMDNKMKVVGIIRSIDILNALGDIIENGN